MSLDYQLGHYPVLRSSFWLYATKNTWLNVANSTFTGQEAVRAVVHYEDKFVESYNMVFDSNARRFTVAIPYDLRIAQVNSPNEIYPYTEKFAVEVNGKLLENPATGTFHSKTGEESEFPIDLAKAPNYCPDSY
jgi:hypothetical protein